jgi:hypothetical protein
MTTVLERSAVGVSRCARSTLMTSRRPGRILAQFEGRIVKILSKRRHFFAWDAVGRSYTSMPCGADHRAAHS